jgi:hypothetical protein
MIVNQDDILADWKTQRFIVVDYNIAKDDLELMVILTDIAFWAEHVEQLDQWCKANPGVHRTGMTVEFDTPEALTLFTLRWS